MNWHTKTTKYTLQIAATKSLRFQPGIRTNEKFKQNGARNPQNFICSTKISARCFACCGDQWYLWCQCCLASLGKVKSEPFGRSSGNFEKTVCLRDVCKFLIVVTLAGDLSQHDLSAFRKSKVFILNSCQSQCLRCKFMLGFHLEATSNKVHLRLLQLTGWLWLPLAAAYETWHMVDLAQVVCPKPTVSASAPTYPEYNVGINYTSVTWQKWGRKMSRCQRSFVQSKHQKPIGI